MRTMSAMSSGLRCGLRVFWWVKNGRGRWVEVSHAPVDVMFTDCAHLRAQIHSFSPPERWNLLVATKQDLGLRTILQQYNRNIDFHTEVSHFISQLRAAGRSRFELELHERLIEPCQ
jgi:hypothetical protein